MPRFFVDPSQIIGQQGQVLGEDARHISRSLRMKVGDPLVLSDGEGWDYIGAITHMEEGLVAVSIEEKTENKTEFLGELVLYQALPKGDKFEFILQKATELGVTQIVPVLTSRCISRPKESAMERKMVRYQRIVEEGAKQAGRGRIPEISPLVDFKSALNQMTTGDTPLLYYEEATQPLGEFLPLGSSIHFLIGSEGGFSPEEVQQAEEQGIGIVSLGQRILRCETAPIVAAATILYEKNQL